ncbi:MAG: TetR/AcrR family transcriptional regulator [Hyphomicrobium sp.]|nr:TetR/AcrR family transcriptional regulator [Hyphomicrobium sp.]
MGRRSLHTPEELRQLILTSARKIIEKQGLPGLSAREIARSIEYSPGTLYNIFENLDDVLLTLQIEMLRDVASQLAETPVGATPALHIEALAKTYVDYALRNRKLWNLLFSHSLPTTVSPSKVLHDYVFSIGDTVCAALAPLMIGASAEEKSLAARVLWAGVHGITAIAVTDKAPVLTASTALDYTHVLTQTFLDGLVANRNVAASA